MKSFREKPDLETAEQFLKDNTFLWNSGMFLFQSKNFLTELKSFSPQILNSCISVLDKSIKDKDFLRLDRDSFKTCPSDSIDYAVMEKTASSAVMPLDAGWNDVGSWNSIWQELPHDKNNNAIYGNGLIKKSTNSLLYSREKLVTAIGIDNIAVIDTKDAILVVNQDFSQDIKSLVEEIKLSSNPLHEFHREVVRPWGKFDSIDSGIGFQVKRITVNPGAKLSIQMHYHRSEHWVVVSGIGIVHYGEDSHELKVNESTYHDKEVVHALENKGKEPLILIEVQVGSYLGEDDIVRFEDKYGRA